MKIEIEKRMSEVLDLLKEKYKDDLPKINVLEFHDYEIESINNGNILSGLIHNTSTLDGQLEGIKFNEELHKPFEPYGNIVIISCNFYKKRKEGYLKPDEKKVKSNRGRKKKVKEKSKRRQQGTGDGFNSQVTFIYENKFMTDISDINNEVFSLADNFTENNLKTIKLYNIKLFRNGRIQIPGVLNDDLSDALPIIEYLKKLLEDFLKSDREHLSPESEDKDLYFDKEFLLQNNLELKVIKQDSIIQNYKTHLLKNPNKIIDLKDKDLIDAIKKHYINNVEEDKKKEVLTKFNKFLKNQKLYLQKECRIFFDALKDCVIAYMKSNDITYEVTFREPTEKFRGYILKVKIGINEITCKLFRGGKINIDSCKSVDDAYKVYELLNGVFLEYKDILFYRDISETDID